MPLLTVRAVLVVRDVAWTWLLSLIILFLLATLPVGSHLLARAAVREAGLDEEIEATSLISPAKAEAD